MHSLQSDPTNLARFFVLIITSSNVDRFQTFFTVRIRRNFVILLSLAIPLHLTSVATLFCDMSMC